MTEDKEEKEEMKEEAVTEEMNNSIEDHKDTPRVNYISNFR